MQIGLIGYGKMGKAIEAIAHAQQHEIVFRITQDNRAMLDAATLRQADVIIEFTRPEAAFRNVMLCLEAGVPVVSGTTGWLDQLEEAKAYCSAHGGALLWASNFSVGVNLFFAVNRFLAGLMNHRNEYETDVTEIHHIHKLDAPSGTGLTLTHDIIGALDRKAGWALSPQPAQPSDIRIEAIREGEVPGTHIVRWTSAVDEITLEHKAHSRTGFASGAVLAATWLAGKTGIYGMDDVLGI
jgi:4-hydroxy-tetrahydrodipicolinate reductase